MAGITPDNLKSAAGVAKTVSQPSTEGTKETAAAVAKGAVTGAMQGGWAGAAKGAAVEFAKSKAGRKTIVVLLVLVLVGTLSLPAGVIIMSTLLTSGSFTGGQSTVAALDSGIDREDIDKAMKVGQQYGFPWQVYMALTRVMDLEDIDIEKLTKALKKAGATTLGSGGVVDGEGFSLGTRDSDKRDHEKEKATYLAALADFGLTPAQAERVYTVALQWVYGQAESCKIGEKDAVQVDEDLVIETPDGKSHRINSTQAQNITKVVAAASRINGMSVEALHVALVAGLTESNFYLYANESVPESLEYDHDRVGSDHDSVGFWQMRPSSGWGTVEELMDIEYQTQAFFGGPEGPNGGSPRGLYDIPGWELMSRGEAAQAVEVSAFPHKYQNNEALALELLTRFGSGIDFCDGGVPLVLAGGHPLGEADYNISSYFGNRGVLCGPNGCTSGGHRGMDLAAPCGTPVYAVADGRVTHSGFEPGGWGVTVKVDHGNGLITRSAHMPYGATLAPSGSQVKQGTRIGEIGNTGTSTGCHLHLEVIKNNVRIDPEPVLKGMGIELIR